MWGSGHWMHLGEGETAARSARKKSADTEIVDKGERPDEWKASDGPTPSQPRATELAPKRPKRTRG